jgi:hypothetical protein
MTKQSSSWGHTLERLSADRLAEQERVAARYAERDRRYKSCTFGRMDHLDPAIYVATYNYVTGRAGRVSWACKHVCADHAAKFATKHGIDLASVPVQAERPRHALERILDGQGAAPEPAKPFRAPAAPAWVGAGLPHPTGPVDPDGERLEIEHRIERSARHSVGGFVDAEW